MKKKILIIVLVVIILIPISLKLNVVIQNNKYDKELLDNVYKNTTIKKIEYLDKNNNYYIVKTTDKVIVLDLNYEEVYNIDINELKNKDLPLAYRRNNLYYEEKKRDKNKLTYKYYDIKTKEEVYEIIVGGA